jgi:hypothetical protein
MLCPAFGEEELSWLDGDPDRCPFLSADLDVCKGRNTDYVQPIEGQKPTGNGSGFDSLVHGSGADRLDLCTALLAHDPRDRPGNRCGSRLCCDSNNVRHRNASLFAL